MPRWDGPRLTAAEKKLKKRLADQQRNTTRRNAVRPTELAETTTRFDPLPALPTTLDVPGPPHGLKIAVITDAQVKSGVPINHLSACGRYLTEIRPDVILCIGDFADMPSLSTYEAPGSLTAEGARYADDIRAAKDAMVAFLTPIRRAQPTYNPTLIMCLGNHEDRITRAINSDPRRLKGVMSLADLGYEEMGWTVYPYLQPVVIGGLAFCHFFPSGVMGRPITTARALLQKMHMSCFAGHLQGRDIAFAKRADGTNMTAIISGCLTPDHKVLTADLRYVPIGEVKVGDKVVSFDENPRKIGGRTSRRRFTTGTVESITRDVDEVFAVKLASGKVFKVTRDHQWLVKTGSKYYWKTTDTLRRGTRIPRLLQEWSPAASYNAGWLAGMYDGEGSLYARKTTGGHVMQLAAAQKAGATLNQLHALLRSELGVRTSDCAAQSAHQLRVVGGAPEVARVLGILRPLRLLAKFTPELLGNITTRPGDLDTVSEVTPLGRREIVRSKIDTGTYVVEGYPHHNSFYQHDEDYLSPIANRHWRGMWVLNQVKDGEFDDMAISIDYLLRKYS